MRPKHLYFCAFHEFNKLITGGEDKKKKKGKKKDTAEAEEAGFEVIDNDEVSFLSLSLTLFLSLYPLASFFPLSPPLFLYISPSETLDIRIEHKQTSNSNPKLVFFLQMKITTRGFSPVTFADFYGANNLHYFNYLYFRRRQEEQ